MAPPLLSWETLGKCLHFPELHLLHVSNGRGQYHAHCEGVGGGADLVVQTVTEALRGARLGRARRMHVMPFLL